jgi:putative restriction endonuclease
MSNRLWTRKETLVALNLYCRLPFGRLHARNPDIVSVAAALDRTPAAVAMKCCNLAAFDPAQRARGIVGLNKASQLDQQIWTEFTANPEEVAYEAEIAFASVTQQEPQLAETVEWEDVQGLDREAVTRIRVHQHFFRAMILASYRQECAVCQLPFTTLLVASHILPWSIDKSQRMNPHNGVCLCALHDRAFDRGLLRITPNLTIQIDEQVTTRHSLAVVQDCFLKYEGKPLTLPERWHPTPEFLSLRYASSCIS